MRSSGAYEIDMPAHVGLRRRNKIYEVKVTDSYA
jgi:hypothetical protein